MGDNHYGIDRIGTIDKGPLSYNRPPGEGPSLPNEISLHPGRDPGIFFGVAAPDLHIGLRQGAEGNVIVVGGCGSGKTIGPAMQILRMWRGAACITDIKGEMSASYKEMRKQDPTMRPYIIFDPTQIDGLGYDPFWWPLKDDGENLINNVKEIALAIIPIVPEDNQPFWSESERGVLAAALLHFLLLGLSFSETMCMILSETLPDLCDTLSSSPDVRVRMLLGEIGAMKPETLACIDRGLRNKIEMFATDPFISHAFRGQREGAFCFNWDNLNAYHIFLHIPAGHIEQWSPAINLIDTQLIRYLERRPEKYSAEGSRNIQTLLLMDEFARFGKLEIITAAMATLRSKCVNICLIIQSIAQLDKIYGERDRRIICDNAQYKVVLNANDLDTQQYFANLIGTRIFRKYSMSELQNELREPTGYSSQVSESQELLIQPYEFATLKKAVVLTPYGACLLEKFYINSERENEQLLPAFGTHPARPSVDIDPSLKFISSESGSRMLTVAERTENARRHAREALNHPEEDGQETKQAVEREAGWPPSSGTNM